MKATILVAAALLAATAQAQPSKLSLARKADPMRWAFDATMEISILAVGYFVARDVDSDHSWRDRNSAGRIVGSGTWAIENGQVCYTQVQPATQAAYQRMCYAPTAHAIGDIWSNTDPVSGNTVTIRIVARQP